MGKVKGEDVILYLQDISDKCNHPIACSRSITFDIQQDLIETSITQNGRFRTYVSGAASWSATLEGLVSILNIKYETVSGALDLLIIPSLPPQNAFVINVPNLCMNIGGILVVSGTGTADGTYTILNYSNSDDDLSTVIVTVEPIPAFTPVDPASITFEQLSFGIENMYDSIVAGTPILVEFFETDNEGHFLKKSGTAYIESISEVASFDNMATFTAALKGTGLISVEYG